MPYCSIDEAWGPSFNRGPPNNESRYLEIDKSKNFQRTYIDQNTNSENNRFEDNSDTKKVDLNDLKKTKKVSQIEPYVLYENNETNNETSLYEKYTILLSENKYLKQQLLKLSTHNPNAQNDLCLYIFTGIFIIYILDIFSKIGKKR